MADGGVLSRLFGGSPQSGLLSPQQLRGAEKRALMDFGLSLLVSSAPPPFGQPRTPLGKAIAMGTLAGRESFERFTQQTRAVETQEAVGGALEEGLSLEALGSAFTEAMQSGDINSARTIVPLLQQAMSAAGESTTAPNLVHKEIPLEGGGKGLGWFNPKNGQLISVMKLPDEGLTTEEIAKIQQGYAQFQTATAKLQEIPQQFRRVFATSQALLASFDEQGRPIIGTEEDVAFRTVSALSAFARLIDPGSVVRSEEMRLLAGQGDLAQKIESFIEGVRAGRVSKSLVKALLAEAKTQLISQQAPFTEQKELAEERLIRLEFDKSDFIFPDPFQAVIDEFSLDGPAERGSVGSETAAERAKRLAGPPVPGGGN